MKRFCSVVLSVLLALSALLVPSTAAPFYENGFDYLVVDSGTGAEIVTYYGLGGDVVIPETLGGLPVVSIQSGAIACQEQTQVTSITLPATLRTFDAYAITGNTSLKTITLQEGNSSLKLVDGVLYNAGGTELLLYPAADERTAFAVPAGVRVLGRGAFYGARNLGAVELPNSVITIESAGTNLAGVFEGCTSLRAISIPPAVSQIGDYAFMDCTALSKVKFSYSFSKLQIGLGAFLNCPNLKSVNLYSNISEIKAEAFGYISSLNAGRMMETNPVDGFEICALDGHLTADYAQKNGFSYKKQSVVSTIWEDMAPCVLGDKDVMSSVKGVSAEVVTDLPYMQSFIDRYLQGTAIAQIEISFTPAAGQSVPERFEKPVFYSMVCPKAISGKSEYYLFYVSEEIGANGEKELVWEYIPAHIGSGYGVWGDSDTCLLFETDRIGTFLLVNEEPAFGDLDHNGDQSALDLAVLAKVLADWDIGIYILGADANGDGSLSATDLVVLAKHLVGWNPQLCYFGQFSV